VCPNRNERPDNEPLIVAAVRCVQRFSRGEYAIPRSAIAFADSRLAELEAALAHLGEIPDPKDKKGGAGTPPER